MSRFYRWRDLELVALSEAFTAEQRSCYSHAPGAAPLISFTDVRGFSFGGSKLNIRHTCTLNPLCPSMQDLWPWGTELPLGELTAGRYVTVARCCVVGVGSGLLCTAWGWSHGEMFGLASALSSCFMQSVWHGKLGLSAFRKMLALCSYLILGQLSSSSSQAALAGAWALHMLLSFTKVPTQRLAQDSTSFDRNSQARVWCGLGATCKLQQP